MLPQPGVTARSQFNSLNMLAGFYNLSSLNVAGAGAGPGNANSGGSGGGGGMGVVGLGPAAAAAALGQALNAAAASSSAGGASSLTASSALSQQHRGLPDSMGLPASPHSFTSSNLNLSASAASSLARQQQQQQQPLSRIHLQEQQQHLTSSSSASNLLSDQMVQQQLHTGGVQHQALNGQQQQQQQHQQQQQVLVGGQLNVLSQQLQSPAALGSVKMEGQSKDPAGPGQQQAAGLLVPKAEVKPEPDLQQQVVQHVLHRSDSTLSAQLQQRQELLQLQQQRQQQQQQLLLQQRMLQAQQQQQQQLMQSLPHLQRVLPNHLQQQSKQQQLPQQLQLQLQLQQQYLQQQQQQQQLQQQQQQQHKLQLLQQQQQQTQALLGAAPAKSAQIEPGMCARRLMQYMFHQRHRPDDNNISFWRKFVAEYFGPRAKKRWCVSLYGSGGRQPTGVFPQDVWHCEICGTRPGRGFETTVEVLPRLSKIKYDSGITEELLFVDMPHEYRLNSGHMVLEYGKAIQESVFDTIRVVRDGQLRIIFNPDLKIKSWEFCARSHEELLSRRLIVPQVSQLTSIAQKYNAATQNGSSNLSLQEMQTNCHLFVTSARQLARNLEVPPVNDLGYTKRYVRCLQISEVVNSMKDLIDFSRDNDIGPIESLLNFPRKNSTAGTVQSQCFSQHSDPQAGASLLGEQVSSVLHPLHLSNGGSHAGNALNGASQNSNPLSSIPSLVLRTGLNTLQNLQASVPNSLSNPLQNATVGMSSSLQQASQANPVSFQNSLSSMSGSLQPAPLNNVLSSTIQQGSAASLLQQSPLQSTQISQQDTQNVVQHFLQEMMMNQQMTGSGSYQQNVGARDVLGSITARTGYGGGSLNGTTTGGSLSNGSGGMGNGNGLVGSHIGSNNSFAVNAGSLGTMGGGLNNSIRNMGANVGSLGNMSAMNTLSGRLNLASVTQGQSPQLTQGQSLQLTQGQNLQLTQGQSLQLQDPSNSLQHDLAGNGLLGNLGTSAGFGGLQYNWKSP